MKIISLLVLCLLVILQSFCQSVSLNSKGVFINKKGLTKKDGFNEVKSVLGEPDRIFNKRNVIWTYDSLGLRIYFDTTKHRIKSIAIDYTKGKLSFSPFKIFSGNLSLYGFEVIRESSIDDFRKILELKFNNPPDQIYAAMNDEYLITLQYVYNSRQLMVFGIDFR